MTNFRGFPSSSTITSHNNELQDRRASERLRKLEQLRSSSSLGLPLIPPATIRSSTGKSRNYDSELEETEDPIRSYIKSAKLDQLIGSEFANNTSDNMNRISSAASHSALHSNGNRMAAADRQARVSMKKQMNVQRSARVPPPEVASASMSSGSTNNNNNINQQNQTEIWNSIDDLFWDHMKEVQNKWNTLKMNDDIWAKLIYFEQNRRLAKAYVSAPVLTVDGSTCGLDGFRIGLSGIDNDYRSLESIASLRSIGQGIKLKIDSQGNILIRKISPRLSAGATSMSSSSSNGQPAQQAAAAAAMETRCSVYVKDWPSTKLSANAGQRNHEQDTCTIHELGDSDASYKLFDMHKFRMQLEKRKLMGDNSMDWRQCVSMISFVRSTSHSSASSSGHSTSSGSNSSSDRHNQATYRQSQLLKDPCWLMLINIIAIDMLKSSICDTNGSSQQQQQQQKSSSTLLRDHRILSTSQQPNVGRPSEQRKVSAVSAAAPMRPHEPLRTSSSASILYNPSVASQPSGRVKKFRINTPSARPSGARFNGSRHLDEAENVDLSAAPSSSYYRRYQSSQQLPTSASQAANNVIYTTFNSKFINPRRKQSTNAQLEHSPGDLTASSDYNSTSRTSSSHYARGAYAGSAPYQEASHRRTSATNYNRKLDPYSRLLTSSTTLHRNHSPVGGGNNVTASASTNSQSMGGHKLSASSFELAAQSERKMPVQSSIRMHYDSFNVDLSRARNLPDLVGHRDKLKVSKESFGLLKRSSLLRHRQPVDHNECSAIQGVEMASNLGDERKDGVPSSQKISRSSTASSSSSGCIDNDYFMSQSSSSMSSSTTQSNECGEEMFSQPASSSGIVCSGNTSDECGDATTTAADASGKTPSSPPLSSSSSKDPHRSLDSAKGSSKSSSTSAKTSAAPLSSSSSRNARNNLRISSPSLPSTTATSNRGFKIKTIPDEYCGCNHDQPSADCEHELGADECAGCADCDCLMMAAPMQQVAPPMHHHDDNPMADCDCCCDCSLAAGNPFGYPSAKSASAAAKHRRLTRGYGSQIEVASDPIYDLLPSPRRPSSRLASPMRSATIDRSLISGVSSASSSRNSRGGGGGGSNGNHLMRGSSLAHIGEVDLDRISPAPIPSDSTMDRKQQQQQRQKENSAGWLERKKYINILLPKFMFGSHKGAKESDKLKQLAVEQDQFRQRGYRKFSSTRMTRSTQNLS